MSSMWTLLVELALLVMKIIGVSAQKQKNFLDWVARKAAETNSSIVMKDRWEEMRKKLKKKIDDKNKLVHPIARD